MSFYGFIVLLHIIGAICGIGSQFAQPLLMSRPKTKKQAEFAMQVNHSIDKLVIFGTLTLLSTGLILGFMNPRLFTQGWYVVSLILFITIMPVAGAIVPKKIAQQAEVLHNHQGEELPESYYTLKKQAAPFNRYTYIATVVIVILMVVKPFN